jgi:hypothetical protein
MVSLYQILRDRLLKAKETQALYYNKTRKEKKYGVRDMVYLSTAYLPTIRASKKLEAKYIGPFKITKVVNDAAYILELPKEMKVHPTFHISLLEDYIEPLETERDQNDPPSFKTGDPEVYKVEEIKGERRNDLGEWTYLVS